jgi:hypothetical protein
MIMDEPTAALGVKETGQVLDLIRRVATEAAGDPDPPRHAERLRAGRPFRSCDSAACQRSSRPRPTRCRRRAIMTGATAEPAESHHGTGGRDDLSPTPERYDRMRYRRAAAAFGCRRSPSGSGGTSGTTAPSRRAARSSGGRSTSASPTSTSRTTMGRRTARPRRPSAN